MAVGLNSINVRKIAIATGFSLVSLAVILSVVNIASSEPACFMETSSGGIVDLTDELCGSQRDVNAESQSVVPPLTPEEVQLNQAIPLSERQRIVELAKRDPEAGYAQLRNAICNAQGFDFSNCPLLESSIIIPGAEPTHRMVELSEIE